MDSNSCPSLHGPRLLPWLSSANEEDKREVLIKLSISSVVIKSTKEALEWLTSGACLHIIMCVWKEKELYIHPLEYTEFSVLCGDS